MTEAEWLSCDDPLKMLKWASMSKHRKSRLFAVACCRCVWNLLPDERSRKAVEVAERHADGAAAEDELNAARRAALEAHDEVFRVVGKVGSCIEWAAAFVADGNAIYAAKSVSWMAATPRAYDVQRHNQEGELAEIRLYPCAVTRRQGPLALVLGRWKVTALKESAPTGAEKPVQVALINCIFGNPFSLATSNSAWLAWNGGTAPQLAQAIYDDRAFDRLPILADALEEAGCTDAALLAHCRGHGPHVRGCWVVDLLLGKD